MPELRRRPRAEPYAAALRTLADPSEDGVAELLAGFGPALGAARLSWQPTGEGWPASAEWSAEAARPATTTETIPVEHGGHQYGWLTLTGIIDRELLGALITSIRLLISERRLRDELVPARAAEVRARLDLRGTRHQLVLTRDQERQRLVAALLKFAGTPLQDVRDSVDSFERSPSTAGLDEVRAALDLATERFRAVARGIYPVLLRERGPAETLTQLAATVPAQVRFAGSLGDRAGWETEAGLYHAAARAMIFLAGLADPVAVTFERDGDRLSVTLSCGSIEADIATELADEAGRISALGGGLIVRADGESTVQLWLFDGLDYRG